MNEQSFYRISVKGIAIDDRGRILLAREDNNMWEMLGGGLEHGEDPRDCLIREIREETGLEIVSVSEKPLYFLTAPSSSGDFQTANVIYLITLAHLEFIPSDECQELRFVDIEEMKKLELFPNVGELLKLLESQQ